MTIKPWLHRKLEVVFGIDLRTLALFRLGLGLLIILDLINRASALNAHYTDWGLLPRDILIREFRTPWRFSIHLLSGQFEFQVALFILAGVLAFSLAVGYRTRLVTILSWILLLSLQTRNPMVLQAGDTILRMLLFWGMFLPLGATYSVDSIFAPNQKPLPRSVKSISTFAVLLQVAFVYWFSYLLKDHPIWKQGEAIYYALSIDHFVTPIGLTLLQHPSMMKGLTYLTLWLEALGPFLVFMPFGTGAFRFVIITLFCCFHLGLAATMELGLFPYISIVGWSLFLPGAVWDRLSNLLQSSEQAGATIYYDNECEFCKRSSKLFKMVFFLLESRIRPAQEVPSIYAEMERNRSWILVDHNGHHHYGFDVWVYCCRISRILRPIYPLFKPEPIRYLGEHFYKAVSRNRGILSKVTSSLSHFPSQKLTSRIGQLLSLICIIYVFLWNLRTLNFKKYEVIFPKSVNWFGQLLGLGQKWNMFAPYPLRDDGWFVHAGELMDGREVDMLSKKFAISWKKPELISSTYENQRWRKYMMNLRKEENKKHRLYYGRYLCRNWNSQHTGPDRLKRFKVYYLRERTLPDFKRSSPQKILLWSHRCFKKDTLPVKPTTQ
jgi:hypothetical protein